MRIPFALILFFLLVPSSLFSQADSVPGHKTPDRFPDVSLELYGGGASVNGRPADQAVSFRGGFKNYFFTGRMFRTDERIFENSWMLGYRIHGLRVLNVTGSLGLSDVAFRTTPVRRNNHYYSRGDYDKAYGFCGEVEIEVQIHVKEKPSAWGIAGSYYYSANPVKNLSVLSAGLKWHVLPVQKVSLTRAAAEHEADKRQSREAERREYREKNPAVVCRNVIRTKFLIGMLKGTHIEYDRCKNGRWAFSYGAGIKYADGLLAYIGFSWPDAMLHGGEISFGVNYNALRNNGWWSTGLKTTVRHRERAGFYAYYDYSWKKMNRTSEDALLQARFAYTFLTRSSVVNFNIYLLTGARASYTVTGKNLYISTPSFQGSVYQVEKEWRLLPAVEFGLDIGFGW